MYKEKTFKEAWLSDTGAYPVMSVIVGAFVFAVGAGFWFMFSHPDNRLTKSKRYVFYCFVRCRKSVFRGELFGQDLA